MRRFLVTMGALAAIALAPAADTRGDDQAIAQTIVQRLQSARDQGRLKGFKVDLEVDHGTVWVKGHVAQRDQHALVMDIARRVPGVRQVVNDLKIKGQESKSPLRSTSQVPSLDQIPDLHELEESSAPAETARAIPAVDQGGDVRPTQGLRPASTGSATASADERIAQTLVARLENIERDGRLQGCGIDLHVEDQVVVLEGDCVTSAQHKLVIDIARRIRGVRQVVDGIRVKPTHRTASASSPMPVPMARATQTSEMQPTPVSGSPVPMQAASGGATGVSYDQPQLPGYSWPSYASYPNYAAVQYPRQYSPAAWPYIGPFYPYPQVPLGWRHVTLKWEDGWWFLDFKSK